MKRIVVLISGSGSNLQALINATQDGIVSGDIVGVISNRKSAYGLERAQAADIPSAVLSFSPFKDRGEPREAYDVALADLVSTYQPDIIVLAGWMRILTSHFINCFPDRLINLHPALPGAHPGTDAIQRAWLDAQNGGAQETGIMVHRVIEEIDAGSVLGIQRIALEDNESLASLTERMHVAEHTLLVQVVRELCLTN